ncbi:homocysteine S-methyltransferase family protein [Vibrio hannami]|uniref:homocysteine S-methyltransferase family protein n=1 Tax=Vibrio hannami TaxID=2717094 RepID=UPI00240EAEF6|nr:homocysteine S-methyltransferase family protein [Vibrio hannami]MDG3085124.1 homocysteine S-methyltransferase family protein [Vibrio hannami]
MSEKKVKILDGGMGRELEKRGAPFRQPEWSALAMMETPEVVCDAHRAFIQSGAEIIITNSYALVPFHIGEEKFKQQGLSLAASAGEMAKKASKLEDNGTLVAASIPPLFGSYRADLYQPERAEEVVTSLIKGQAPYADIWLAETQSLMAETFAVHEYVRKLDGDEKPFWVAFTIEDSVPTVQPQLRSGETVKQAVEAMLQLNVAAILFNCSQPEVMESALKVAKKVLSSSGNNEVELGVYANAFPPTTQDEAANDGLSEMREDLNLSTYTGYGG